jgi:hypothetical protein
MEHEVFAKVIPAHAMSITGLTIQGAPAATTHAILYTPMRQTCAALATVRRRQPTQLSPRRRLGRGNTQLTLRNGLR